MEIRVNGRPLTVTMRTPGDDFDLAIGFLVSEGVVHAADDVASVRYCAGATADGGNTYNVVDVGLAARTCAPPDAVPGAQLLHDLLVRTVRQGEPGCGAHVTAPGQVAGRPAASLDPRD